ncbi:MAG: tandem-95 repeat protein [Chloroflexi bacterium]|nr:tandem-95 repeat protein [Chloroflexota bacterium]
MNRSRQYGYWILTLSITLLLLGFAAVPSVLGADRPPTPEKVVQRAWQLAQESGAYHFTTEIVQTTYPAPTMANLGRSSRQEAVYIEGDLDLPMHTMWMSLWQDGGTVLNPRRDGVEIRIEGDRAYVRQTGGAWQEIDDFTGAFAPSSDLMSYLVGAKNVQELDTDTRQLPSPDESEITTVTFTRYSFDVDGPVFARHVRDRLETYLREKGELPLGMTLDTSRTYLDMTGQGEVWIDSQGLPLRLTVHLVYPEQDNGERVEADIKNDFAGFAPQSPQVSDSPIARGVMIKLDLSRTPREWQQIGQRAVLVVSFLGFLMMLLARRATRKVYAILILIVVVSMVVTPLLQSHHVYAFYERQSARAAQYEQRVQEQETTRELQEELSASDWHPHRDPLAVDPQLHVASDLSSSRATLFNSQSTHSSLVADDEGDPDLDQDGLTNGLEEALETDPAVADSDGDDLDDGVEVLRLGTDPLNPDTDGDGIADNVEVAGFTLPGQSQRWYLDPKSPDTNEDGQVDTTECPDLVGEDDADAFYCSDTDNDNIPDVFDYDNDDDGVPDKVDISPNGVVDRWGKRDDIASLSPFDGDHPFALQVDGLTADEPVLVDFQLRPVTATHLSYALNVLDWPGDDSEGQIQRVKNTTFATSDNPQVRDEYDPRAANGDMRLIPMLEIEMPVKVGDKVPLALTNPAVTVQVRGDISATVQMEQHDSDSNQTVLEFTRGDEQTYYAGVWEGACPASPPSSASDYQCYVDSDQETCTIDGRLTDLANGEHQLIFYDAVSEWTCTRIDNVINGPYTDKMIDPAPLQPYGISVREADESGTLLAYVPLNLQADDTGGGKAAFSARMIYWPGADAIWEQAQYVRVVWLVQMLTDWCDETGFQPSNEAEDDPDQYSDELDAWCADSANRTMDDIQIVHMYDEEWYLTGLSVREDHGLDVAVAYENPATDTDPYNEDALWHLAWGLGSTFAAGRDSNGDNERDITIFDTDQAGMHTGNSTIKDRFDPDPSTNVPEKKRWAIPKNTLRVENLPRYDHQDYITYIAMTETPRILDQFSHDVAPTLLFAREERYRGVDLGTGVWDDGILSIDATSAKAVTIAALQWAPYRYNSDIGSDGQVVGWESYPIDEYWDQMEIDLTDQFELLDPEDSEYVNLGRMVVARSFYISLVHGIVSQVENGLDVMWTSDPDQEDSDRFLTTQLKSSVSGVKVAAKQVAKATLRNLKYVVELDFGIMDMETGVFEIATEMRERSLFESLGKAMKEFFITPWKTLVENLGKARTAVIGGVVALGAVAALGISIYAASKGSSGIEVAVRVLLGLGTVLAIAAVVRTASALLQAAKTAGSVAAAVKTAVRAANGLKGCVTKAAVAGLVLGAVITWAAFGLQAGLSGGMSRVEWGYAIAGAIASTIVAVIMFVVELIPLVGPLIVAVIALIDTAVTLLCSAFLSDEQQQGDAGQWLCGGLTGTVTNLIKFIIFSSNVMVDMQPEDYERLEFSSFDANDFVDPAKGFSEGNLIQYGISLTNTIDLIKIPSNLGGGYWYQYSDGALQSSTFEYRLQSEEVDFHDELSRNTMKNEWRRTDSGRPFFITETIRSEDGLPLPEPGINRPAGLYVSEGYAIPLQECYVGVCTIQTERGTEHYDLGQGLKFDIFPVTLDGFYDLTPKQWGWTLAWGQEGDVTFPQLQDADGDGMNYDQHDNLWDADYDGLSDWHETQTGSDSTSPDSDGDGLTDYQEARLGTYPGRADSDGDGLLDCEEVFHQVLVADIFGDGSGPRCDAVGSWSGGWEFVYAMEKDGDVHTTWVASDPLAVDTDGDGLTDFQEKTFGFHPRWLSGANVLTLESVVMEDAGGGAYTTSDGFVAPGDTLHYEATVTNELYNRYAQGLLETDFPREMDAVAVPPEDFILYPQEQQTIAGEVDVDGVATSGIYSLTQVAGALITDWSEVSGHADLWMPFEDPITMDRSGSQPSHDGICVGTCQSLPGLYGDAMRLYGNSYMTSDFDPSEINYAVSLWFRTGQADGGLFSAGERGVQVSVEDGNVCSRVPWNYGIHSTVVVFEDLCTGDTSYNDGDWHHVVQTFGSTVGGHKLYVDGLLVGSGSRTAEDFPSQHGVDIGRSLDPDSLFIEYFQFNGRIDDVRVFNEGLTSSKVQTLFNQPVFDMTFDENAGWKDHSAFGNDGSCQGDACPSRVSESVSGKAAKFDGGDHISIDSDPSLNLNDGQFTIAAWIYPKASPKHCVEYWHDGTTCLAWHPEGILGRRSGETNGYPSLQRVDVYDLAHGEVEHAIRFGFGTGSEWLEYTSGDVLTEHTWNHVVVTFYTDTLKLYVNGELQGEDTTTFHGEVPSAVTDFTIGRSSNRGKITFQSVLVTDEDDPGDAELCMAFDGSEIFNQSVNAHHDEDGDGALDPYPIDRIRNFYGQGTLKMWENDSNPKCGSAPNGNDQLIDTWNFSTTDPGYGSTSKSFSGDVTGRLFSTYANNSIPFHGKIDEVQIYKRALTEYDVVDLYRAATTVLHLQLDDPPGETSFQDAVGEHDAACDGGACPTSGVIGRVNGAAWFEAAEQDHLSIANSGINQLTKDFTVAAWIKPTQLSDIQRIVATARTQSTNGFAFGTNGTNLRFTTFDVHNYDITGIELQADRWTHVAAVMDGENNVSFYVDGALMGQVDHTSPAAADIDDELLFGATTLVNSASLTQQFDGQIDDVYVFQRALPEHEIKNIYRRAPVFQMHFDENQGATQFVDDSGNNNHATCTDPACPQVGMGIEGQLGWAAEFDGSYDKLEVPDKWALDLNEFSVGAWVRPAAVNTTYPQELVGKYTKGQGIAWNITDINYRLYIEKDGMTPVFQFASNCNDTSGYRATSKVPLVMNQWNHVVGTYDGHWLTIYVNGVPQGRNSYDLNEAIPCKNIHPLRVGGYRGNSLPFPYRHDGFAGRLDEVTIYRHALSKQDIEAIFQYQAKWVEDRQSHDVTVDADDPVVELVVPATHLPNQDVQLLVTAQDLTSGVTKVELGVRRYDAGNYVWTDAPRCRGGQTWCPTFVPSGGDASYTLWARATDLVGHIGASSRVTVYVDDAPPVVGFDFADETRMTPAPHPTRRNAWTLHLSGWVLDQYDYLGSGVATDTVKVRLFDTNGALAGPEAQAAVTGNIWWAVDYALDEARPNGPYTVTVEAADRIALYPKISAEQIARHTTITETTIYVDATAPVANLDLSDMPVAITKTTVISGVATERPVPLLVTWLTDEGGEEASLTIACGGVTLYSAEPGAFPPQATTHNWKGQVHHNAACQVSLTDSAGDGGVTGTVRICGSQVANWSDSYGYSYTISFTADSSACNPDTPVAGVNGVQIAFTPILPGSPFYNPAGIPDPVLHLPLDDTPAANGTLTFQDTSGLGHDATCNGDRCPLTGEPGKVGSATHFDGVDDLVRIPDSSDFDFGTGPFAISMWLNNEGDSWSHILNWSNGGENSFKISLGQDNRVQVYLVIGYSGGTVISNGGRLQTDGWHHLVVVRDSSGHFTTYIDGSETGSGTSSADMNEINAGTPIWISKPPNNTLYTPFKGLIDEIRIFGRALTPSEVEALALATESSEPTLILPLDEPWALDGTTMPDMSGFGNYALLQTGADDGDNKAVYGQVGAAALYFDGVDDHVQVAPSDELDLSDGLFTQAAWVLPDPQDTGTYPILSSGAYTTTRYDYPFLNVVNRTQLYVGFGDGNDVTAFSTGDILTEDDWNHVATTFDGSTYKIYVNGQEQVSTDQFAGKLPHPTQQFDLGRGTDSGGGALCPVVTELTLKPSEYSGGFYRVRLDGDVIFTSDTYLYPERIYATGQSPEFCGSVQVEIEWGQGQWNGISWHSMGTYTINSDSFSGSYQFSYKLPSSAVISADVVWQVAPAASSLLHFEGWLDDVRVYPRPLLPLEIYALYKNTWRGTTLTSGSGTDLATWATQVPSGLEGAYRVDVRGWDVANNIGDVNLETWRGEVDTLAPRVSMTRTATAEGYYFTTVAEDFNLAEEGFVSPCGAGTITDRRYYGDSWYLTFSGGDQKLYQLTAECELPVTAMQGEIGDYDTPGLANDVVISGSYAYIPDGLGGLQIVDISDPGFPTLAGSRPISGVAYAVAIADYPLTSTSALVSRNAVPDVLSLAGSGKVLRAQTYGAVADRGGVLEMIEINEPSHPHNAKLHGNSRTTQADRVPAPLAPTAVFTVTATSPLSNGLVIARDGIISATFSAPMSNTTVNTHTFTVRGQQTGIYEGIYSFGPVQFDATDDFKPGEEIVVNLSSGIRATDGSTLDPYAWQFRAATVNGTGVFSDSGQRLGSLLTFAVALGDLDGDSDLDVFATSRETNTVWLNSDGIFTASSQTLGVSSTQAVALGDLDNDGDLDAFVGNGDVYGAQPNTVWLNEGGVFTNSGQTIGVSKTLAVALGDLDGDGDLDAFLGNDADIDFDCPGTCYNGGINQVWLNDGSVFTDSGQTLDGGSATQAVVLGDVDGDGDLDALVGNYASEFSGDWLGGENRIWLNDGTGVFTDSSQTLGITKTHAVALGDLDGDGDLDAFIGNYALPDTIWLNDSGVFTDTGQRLGNGFTDDVALGDVDSDGDLDAFVTNDTVVQVWLNDGSSVYVDSGQSLSVSRSQAVALGDLDGDGDLDAFVGDTGEPGPDTVWLNNANPPVANDDSFAVAKDSSGNVLDVLANDDDPDGDGLTVIAVGDPVSGTATTDGSMVVFTPTQDFSGTVVFAYTISDPGALTDTAAITVSVGGSNDPPVAQNDVATTDEDMPVTIDVLDNDSDPDGQTLFLSAVGMPANGSTGIAGDAVDYTPDADWSGTDIFTYTTSDGELTDTATVTVTVYLLNDPPTLNAIADRTVDEDAITQTVPLSGISTGAANETQSLTVTVRTVVNPDVVPDPIVTYTSPDSSGILSFAPLPDQFGTAHVEVTVSDGLSQTIRSFEITVNSINDPPTMLPISDQTTDEDTLTNVSVSGISYGPTNENAQRPDLAMTASSTNTALLPHPTVVYSNGVGTYTSGELVLDPVADQFGLATVIVTITDGLSETVRTFQVTIAPVNDPPTLDAIPDLQTYENAGVQVVNLTGIGTGATNETQSLTVTASSSYPGLIPHPTVTYVSPDSSGSLSFAPVAEQYGEAMVTVAVTDGLSETLRTFLINVDPRHAGTYAYVAAGSAGLQQVDVSNPGDPQYVSGYTWAWWHPYEWHQALDVVVSGQYAYMATGKAGVVVLDISNPDDLQYAGSLDTDGYATAIAISGTYAYIADGLDGLQVMDVSDPSNPQPSGSLGLPGYAKDVVVSGTYAYVPDYEGLQVIDVSNPGNPQLEGTFETPSRFAVAVSGHDAYLVGYVGLQVVDVSDPSDPQLTGEFRTGRNGGVAVSQDLAYIASYENGLLVVNPDGILPQSTACDSAGNCATEKITFAQAQTSAKQLSDRALALAGKTAAEGVNVSILNVPPVLDSIAPISITGRAYAITSSLRALTVTVDSVSIYTDSWASDTITEATWWVDWTPASEGQHVIQAVVAAWDASIASDVITITVDAQPPQIRITSAILTGTHYYEPRTLDLTGLVSDTNGVASVRASVVGTDSDWFDATLIGNRWIAPWRLGLDTLPDGTTFIITAQAFDIVGHTIQVTKTVVVDVAPPAPMTLTLSSGGSPLAPADILREVSPSLTLDWTASSDGSGLSDYLVRWTTQTTSTLQVTEQLTDQLSSQLTAYDGQKLSVQVAAQDVYAQQRWQEFGHIYVDSPRTPDYVVLEDADGIYRGWMESGCTLVGVDRRVELRAMPGAALNAEQNLYATWNAEAIRLAWSGANWNTDGDLFIYLDTESGGTITVFNPYLSTITNTAISLPDEMTADTLVWVQDSKNAVLLHWDGGEWAFETLLSTEQYRFDPALNDGQTDLYLAFDLIGLSSGQGLGLVALASEEGALRLWATMPDVNPVNSERAAKTTALVGVTQVFTLSHSYRWDGVNAGVCPNGSDSGTSTPFSDTDVQVYISTNPAGASYNLLGDDLFWLQDLLLNNAPADVTSFFSFLGAIQPTVGDGHTITYTVTYRNQGTITATGVYADVTAQYAMRLPDGDLPDRDHQIVLLGDISPGEDATKTFRGVIDVSTGYQNCVGTLLLEDCTPYLQWATLDARIYDDAHPDAGAPLEWIWVDHRVDYTPPNFFGIQQPTYLIGPGAIDLYGYAYDDVGVPEIGVEVQAPAGGTSTLTCADSQPEDGAWSCAWDATASNGGVPLANGDVFTLSLQAIDGFGQASVWSKDQPFLVDTVPPTVTVEITTTRIFSGALVRDTAFTLVGDVADDGGVAGVNVCVEDACRTANLQLAGEQSSVTYNDILSTPIAINSTTTCGGGEIVRTFSVTESFAIAQVSVGFSAEHARRDDVQAELQSPAGTIIRLLNDDGISGTQFGNYDVLLNDAAPVALDDAQGDHDPLAPFYDQFVRPDEPLRAFQGQDAAGDWTLRICDLNPAENDGVYRGSRLVLVPRDTAAKAGRWTWRAPDLEILDYVSRTVSIYGQDTVGNQTDNPLDLVVWVDNVSPVITVTAVISESVPLSDTVTVLSGTVTDGGPLADVFVHVQTPGSEFYRQRAARDGEQWWFDLQPLLVGQYTVWVNANDQAGNVTTIGPFGLNAGVFKLYLPLTAHNWRGLGNQVYLPVVMKE